MKEKKAWGRMVAATKGGHYDFAAPGISRMNRDGIKCDLEESLRTLGTDCIDLYWLHRDNGDWDMGGMLEFMESLVKSGKIRYYGASNFKRERLEAARRYAVLHGFRGFSAVSNQWSAASVNHGKNPNQDKSLVMMDGDMYRWHREHQVPMVPFSSSAHGFFSKLKKEGIQVPDGELDREDVTAVWKAGALPEDMKAAYMNERNLKLYRILCRGAEAYGISMHSMTQAYFLNMPFQVFPVGAVSGPEQLDDVLAAGSCVFDRQLIRELEECGVE